MRKMKTILSPEVKPMTKVLVTGMAYECKDGRFAASADVTGLRRKDYFKTWDDARNAAKAFAYDLLNGRPYKPGYVNGKGRYTINLWS
jgi:hypothetical protein